MSRARGIHFGRYEALFRLAGGGMAEVFAARIRGEAGFERLVAVKRMLPHLAADERFVGMFLDEARLAARIQSPHVVSTLDLGRDDEGAPYIVLELVKGVSFLALLRQAHRAGTRLAVPLTLEVLAQAALGLHHAHVATTPSGDPMHIVHRDVSPSNLLVGVDGSVKVSDFGIAKASVSRLSHTRHGGIKGKIAYLSPEQATSAPVDGRSDVYGLGVVAWQAFAGRRLYPMGLDDTELLSLVRSPPVAPRLDTVRDDLPPRLVDAVARALERDADARFESADVFAAELRQAVREAAPAWGGAVEVARALREDPPDELTRLEERLRRAADGLEESTEPGADDEDPPGTMIDDPGDAPTPRPAREGLYEQATVALAPDAPPPSEISTAITRRRSPVVPIAVAVIVGLSTLGVGGLLLLMGGEDEDRATVVPAAGPASEGEPPAVEPPPTEAMPATVAQPDPAAMAGSTPDPASPDPAASPDPDAPEPEPEVADDPPRRRRARRAHRRAAPRPDPAPTRRRGRAPLGVSAFEPGR